MKKSLRKLALSKETLRNLGNPALHQAAGGSVYTCTYYNCESFYCPTSNGPWLCADACIEP